MQVNVLLCQEAAELLLPQGFDDARVGLDAMLAPDEQHGQQWGGLRDMALGCDEEMELEDGGSGSGMVVAANAALEAGRRRAAQQQPAGMVAMAEVSERSIRCWNLI